MTFFTMTIFQSCQDVTCVSNTTVVGIKIALGVSEVSVSKDHCVKTFTTNMECILVITKILRHIGSQITLKTVGL